MNNEPVIKEIFQATKTHDLKAPVTYFISFQAIFSSEDLGAALSVSIVLLFLQLEVAALISTPHVRSMANQIIRFNTTNNVGENSTADVIAQMPFSLLMILHWVILPRH